MNYRNTMLIAMVIITIFIILWIGAFAGRWFAEGWGASPDIDSFVMLWAPLLPALHAR